MLKNLKIATKVKEKSPSLFSINPRKNKRTGPIYIDIMRNSYGQTGIAPYSIRAKKHAPVATPITWDKLFKLDTKSNMFNIYNVFDYIDINNPTWSNFNYIKNKI